MAYRYEQNTNGESDLVIDGFENGIADSPFKGIANIRNLTVRYYDGVAYVSYKRQACSFTSGTFAKPLYATQSPDGIIYIVDNTPGGYQIWKQTAVNGTQFALLTGISVTNIINGIQFWNNYLIVFGNGAIEICGDGSGDSGVTSSNWNTAGGTSGVWPMKAPTVTMTGAPAVGATSATLSSYTDAQGTSRAFWNGPTGSYLGTINSQNVLVTLTQGDTAMNWYPALNTSSASAMFISVLGSNNVTAGNHVSLISNNDGNLYFCNGAQVGSFAVNANQTFAKGNMKTFTFNASALALPVTDGALYLTELRNMLLVAANHKIYPWDRFSPQWQNPVPIDENIVSMINILNNVYILAGNKGNIYISNGYNAQRFKKIPDNIAGVIDPEWTYGGVMSHRQYLYFQALAKNPATGTSLIAGIFSLNLDTGAIIMEAQNSAGLLPSGVTFNGILIDNSSGTLLKYDNYYSAYGASTSGIDYNNTTPWSGGEAVIETDIVPIGTVGQPKTFSSAEFKLDQPMTANESISLYARQSLSDSYTLIGTTTTAVLSDFFNGMTFEKWQWIQFKVVLTSTTGYTTASFVRLREIRIR